MDHVQHQRQKESKKTNPSAADRVMVTYYTDPLCCWSWALESHWKKFTEHFSHLIDWNYVMCGMIQDWKSYNDPLNAVSKPLQLGPVWMHASQISGSPMDYSIWHKDPPASSFPSCIAVKCAALQSASAGELLLKYLREAVMIKGLNIARESVIFAIAGASSEDHPSTFSLERFKTSWEDGTGAEAFKTDLQQARFLKIGRYPTMTFTNKQSTGIMITGYRPYDVLVDAMNQLMEKNANRQTHEETNQTQ